MSKDRGLGVPREGAWLRRLPLVSLVSFALLALLLVWAFKSTLASYPACFTPGIGVPCRTVSPLWLPLAALWGSSAAGVAALMGTQAFLARRDRTLDIPAGFLLAFGVVVSLLGLLWLGAQPWARSMTSGVTAELGLHIAYITAALVLFAATFVDFDPDRLPSRTGPAVIAAINAGVALTGTLVLGL